ncbi:hypothetical protein HD553DRAFT_227646 [Filobasidium floriforme]|uniref:uncharacterized protein n=1 Tax=Filobasidium floriforme TaxID=5210 RepID=UPI001E8D6A43|nr:uncharacterized protein HD553DRAFT_227646 [Filobasidium floriforme]KAH8085854.1 hypothetical protein HD553DRAFT_227646 [Filobasidium floriforme]
MLNHPLSTLNHIPSTSWLPREARGKRPAHVADRDDVFGPLATRTRSANSASSVASGLQDLSLSSDRVQSPAPTAQAHVSTPMESATVNASNPSEATACSRHGFKMAISYREVTEEDEVKDRRRRQRDQLLHKDAATRSHIYSVRHQSRQVDLAADARYLPAGEGVLDNDVPVPQPQQHRASSLRQHLSIPEAGLHDAGTPPRTREAKLSSNVAKNKVIEAELLMAMRGRVNKKMIDIQPSSDMTPTERSRWNAVVKTLAHEMKTPGHHLHVLTDKLKTIHRNNPSGEAVLSGEGAEFANIVTRRLAAAVGGRTKQRLTGIFRSAGNHDMKDGDIPQPGRSSIETPENKIDIIVHGDHAEEDDDRQWEHVLTFGEVKVEASWDLKDELLGQMLRYLVSLPCWLDIVSSLFAYTTLATSAPFYKSEKSCRIIRSRAGMFVSRYAVIYYAFSRLTLSASALHPHTVLGNRKTTKRSSVPSLCCPDHPASYRNNGSHLLKRTYRYEKPMAILLNIV